MRRYQLKVAASLFAQTPWPPPRLSWLLYRTHLSLQGPEPGARFVPGLVPVLGRCHILLEANKGPASQQSCQCTRQVLRGLRLQPWAHWAGVSPQVVQMYKENPEAPRPPAPRAGGLRWGLSPTLPQSFARVTTSMTVALHPPPLPGAYIHPASDEPPWSPATTLAADSSSNLTSRGPCSATE